MQSSNSDPSRFLGCPSEKVANASRPLNTSVKLKPVRKSTATIKEADTEDPMTEADSQPSNNGPVSIRLLQRFPVPTPTDLLGLLALTSKTSLGANPGRTVSVDEAVKTAKEFDLRLRVDHACAKVHAVMALCWLKSSGDISHATEAKQWAEVLDSPEFRQLVGSGMAVDDELFGGLTESPVPAERILAQRLKALKISAATLFLS